MTSIGNMSTVYTAGSIPDSAGFSLGNEFKVGKQAMSPEKIDAASKDFESMFVSQMLEQMFGESEGDDAFGDADTNDVYKGLLMDQYGKLIARSGGIGIAIYVKQELLKQQEVKS